MHWRAYVSTPLRFIYERSCVPWTGTDSPQVIRWCVYRGSVGRRGAARRHDGLTSHHRLSPWRIGFFTVRRRRSSVRCCYTLLSCVHASLRCTLCFHGEHTPLRKTSPLCSRPPATRHVLPVHWTIVCVYVVPSVGRWNYSVPSWQLASSFRACG